MISTDKNEQELDIWIKKHFDNLKNLSIEYLKKFENIIDFESIYQPIPENILNQFIFNRIYGKKKKIPIQVFMMKMFFFYKILRIFLNISKNFFQLNLNAIIFATLKMKSLINQGLILNLD